MSRMRSSRAGWRLAVGGWREKRRPAESPASPSPPPTANRQPPTGQSGFTLAALIVMLTIISIVIAYTVPTQWSLVMRRERERQTIFLMKQFARGIDNWERKHQGLPVPRSMRG